LGRPYQRRIIVDAKANLVIVNARKRTAQKTRKRKWRMSYGEETGNKTCFDLMLLHSGPDRVKSQTHRRREEGPTKKGSRKWRIGGRKPDPDLKKK